VSNLVAGRRLAIAALVLNVVALPFALSLTMVAYLYYVLAAIALVIGVIAGIRILAGLGYGLPVRILVILLLVVPLINLIDLGVLIGLASKRG
jgi:hypothetical protein